MDTTQLTAVVTLLVALSVASERLVEIVKGVVPWLNQEIKNSPTKEGWRKASLQLLAVAAGILTASLSKDAIPDFVSAQFSDGKVSYLALGLLASGGSGLWNSILNYAAGLKGVVSK